MTKGRYEIRAWAPSPRAKRGEVLVRTMRIFTDDPHTAAIELYRLNAEQKASGAYGRGVWRFEALDHGAGHARKLGVVVSYQELVKRAHSRDPSRSSSRSSSRSRARMHGPKAPKLLAEHIRLSGGGYDRRGRYWGHHKKLYLVTNTENDHFQYVRAESAVDAKKQYLAGHHVGGFRERDASRRSRPPPLPSREIQAMTALLARAGYPHPASSAAKLAAEGVGASELAFRLKHDSRPPARSKTRRAKKRTRR